MASAKKTWRAGTRVRFVPNPASYALYGKNHGLPATGEEGTVVAVPIGRGRVTFLPGPGGGLVYVEWDRAGVAGVSPHDLGAPASGRSAARAGNPAPGKLGNDAVSGMRLAYLQPNQAYVFLFNDQTMRLEGEDLFFQQRAAAVAAAKRRGLAVDKSGRVTPITGRQDNPADCGCSHGAPREGNPVVKVGGHTMHLPEEGHRDPSGKHVLTYTTVYQPWEEGADEPDHETDEGHFADAEPDEVDREEGISAADKAITLIEREGPVEASSSSFHSGIWYTTTDDDENFRTGERTQKSFHLKGFSEAEERAVYHGLTRRRR